jgi:small-conductance mechanosensitive channel
MTPAIASVLDQAANALGGFLPRLAGALVLLLVGVVAARLLGRLTFKGLMATGLDDLGERFGVHDTLERVGLERSLSRLTSSAVRLILLAVVVFAALSLLGLQFLSDSLNQAILFLPRILAALALLLAGVVLGGLARRHVDRLTREMDFQAPLGRAAQIVIVVLFGLTAAAQIAISTAVLLVLAAIVLAGAIATLALAFGLGGRGIARELSAAHYVRSLFEVGQVVTVEGHRGRIEAIDTTTTTLADADGETLHVPNHLLLESIVRRHPEEIARAEE